MRELTDPALQGTVSHSPDTALDAEPQGHPTPNSPEPAAVAAGSGFREESCVSFTNMLSERSGSVLHKGAHLTVLFMDSGTCWLMLLGRQV